MTVRQKLQTPYGALMLAHLAGHDGAEMGLALLVIPVTYCKGQREAWTRAGSTGCTEGQQQHHGHLYQRERDRERQRESAISTKLAGCGLAYVRSLACRVGGRELSEPLLVSASSSCQRSSSSSTTDNNNNNNNNIIAKKASGLLRLRHVI